MNTVLSISKYHFPIAGVIKETGKCELLGTCIMLRLDDKYFLLSAGHVMSLRDNILNKELWLWNYTNQNKYIIPDEHFIELPRLFFNEKVKKENKYIIIGYPYSQNKKRLHPSRLKLPKIFAFFTERCKKSNIKGYEELATIACFDYNEKNITEKGKHLPKPNGMSGGGVWVLSDKSRLNPRLMAIPVSYDYKNKIVNAVKTDLVLSTIKCFFNNTILDQINLEIYMNEEDGIIAIPHDLINREFTEIIRNEVLPIYFGNN